MGRDSVAAKRAGCLLAGEDFILRRAAKDGAGSCREVLARLDERTYAQLIDAARRYRQTPSAVVADYVTAGLADISGTMKSLKGKPEEPEADLIHQLAEARAALREMKDKVYYEQDCRALRFQQKEDAEKRLVHLEKELTEEQALRVGAIERMKKAEAERDDARAVAEGLQRDLDAACEDIFTMQVRNDQLLTEISACARPLPPIITITAKPDVAPETREALLELAQASAAQLRSICAMRAAGNSPREIAHALGVPVETVKSTLKGAA